MRYWPLLLLQFVLIPALGQTRTQLTGTVKDHLQEPLPNVLVRVLDSKALTHTDSAGRFSLLLPSQRVIISFTKIGYKDQKLELDLFGRQQYEQEMTLYPRERALKEVTIEDGGENFTPVVPLQPATFSVFPAASGNFESLLKVLPGVSANNELTSQYSVRGGNFDENLAYINDIEIYQPFLVRNGQQEGLSFINPVLVGKVRFSAGGFESRYGDKLSSVLAVDYTKPDSSVYLGTVGLTGASITGKRLSKDGRSYTLLGIRQKTNRSVLQSQSTSGSYDPAFYDVQLLYNRDLNAKISANYFGSYNFSKLLLKPVSNETAFGTAAQQYRLTVHFQGEELNRYESILQSLGLTYKASDVFQLKWLNSSFKILERAAVDISGQYLFEDLNGPRTNMADSSVNRGSGTSISKNESVLESAVYASEVKGFLQKGSTFWEGGLKFQKERIKDRFQEYLLVDSGQLDSSSGRDTLLEAVNGNRSISRNRLSAYVQGSIDLRAVRITAGVRSNYNLSRSDLLISPRVNVAYQPANHENISFRVSAGLYSQPPFYRELLHRDGSLLRDEQVQRSIHYLAGIDKRISRPQGPLRISTELYYKALSGLIPYKVENLKVQYFPDQRAHGYATGADLSLNGEFVEGLESFFRLSLMSSKEDIEGDFFIKRDAQGSYRFEPGYLKRPTDQRINFSVFFQDQLLRSADYKVHLNLLYGSRLPVGPPRSERYADVFSIPPYKRADIGFSRDFLPGKTTRPGTYLRSLILYAGVFNFFGNRNTVSYLWISDINNNQFAIPNHLTGRVLNLKLIGRFQ